YTVFSDDPSKVQKDPDVKPRTWSNVLVPDFVQQDGKGLPDNIVERLGIGGKLVDVNKWEKFEPASLFGDFHPSQDAELKSVRFPVAKTEELRARILQGGSMPSVMIVDSFFDAKHCDLPQDFVVYDCSSAVDRDAKVCPIVSGDFHYQGSASGQATASMSASLTHPTGISVPPAREKCGDAGRFSLETPQQTEAFIRERHGTHLAGIIASRWDGFGAGGINPMAKIIGVQVDMDNLTDEGYGSWLLRVIGRIMFEQQVHVVNLSLGYLPKQPTMATSDQERHEWLSELIENHGTGVLFVAAAGNTKETDGCFLTPACLGLTQDNVVTVVALDTDGGAVLSGSNSNSGFALGADGEGILGTMPLNKYGDMSGSSQSAAIVSGAVSLALALGERWTPRGTRERLIACSDVSRDLMGAMVGGKLDIECFLDGGRDRTVDEDGDVKSAKLVRVDRGGQASGELEFFNNGTSRTEPIPIADILGFQRVENDPADIVLFLQPESNPDAKVVRLEGSIPQDQELVFREADGPRSKLKVDEVVKFTRRAI
ncbi:MAG: hypothetical protein JWQ89_3446, partial [Devosia sp.]|uniref:S8 family peptidase n=1 Tax=Devosia sp. TaxID=1871048 RepID=UPI002632A6FA